MPFLFWPTTWFWFFFFFNWVIFFIFFSDLKNVPNIAHKLSNINFFLDRKIIPRSILAIQSYEILPWSSGRLKISAWKTLYLNFKRAARKQLKISHVTLDAPVSPDQAIVWEKKEKHRSQTIHRNPHPRLCY